MHGEPTRALCARAATGLLLVTMLAPQVRGQTVTLHLTGQVDIVQDGLAFFPAVSVGSPFTVDLQYSVNPALYSRALSQYQNDNNFLPNEELISWTANYPGRTFHHDDLTDNVGLAGQNFVRILDYPADFTDQFFVQTDRRDTAAGVTDVLTMQFILNGSMVWNGDILPAIPSELDLSDWAFMKSFAVQYSSAVTGGSSAYSLAYGEIDTLTIVDRPGTSVDNPMLPSPDPGGACPGSGCVFFALTADTVVFGVNSPVWIDPEIAVGYDYEVVSGPNISSIELPTGIGDGQYDVYYFDDALNQFVLAATVGGMQPLDLTTFDAAGFAHVRVLGIEAGANLAPDDPLAFPTGLTFLSAGQVGLTMTPITLVPEPASVAHLACLLACGWRVRRRRRVA